MKLTTKQRSERIFHDKLARSLNFDAINIEDAFSIGAPENRIALKIFRNINNRRILDLGCGSGESAVFWAVSGARVYGIDISAGMVQLAKKLAGKYKVRKRCHFQEMTGENLKYPANYFDFVFGNGVLHHMDIPKVSTEVCRVLKPRGTAVFIEPLIYNPIINIYRRLADKVRTTHEKPLRFAQIDQLKKTFSVVTHREYHFLTLLIFVWFFLISGIHPNQERYWKKLLKVKGPLKALLSLLLYLDNIFLRFFPPLRYLCWNTVIILKK